MSLFGKKTEDTKKTTPVTDSAVKVKAKPAAKAPALKPVVEKDSVVSSHPSRPAVHIIQPLVSEKAMILSERNTYVFLVDPGTNKSEVKKEIENLYKVDVIKVTTGKHYEKAKHFRGLASNKKFMKKAMVTVKPGQKIEIFNK